MSIARRVNSFGYLEELDFLFVCQAFRGPGIRTTKVVEIVFKGRENASSTRKE